MDYSLMNLSFPRRDCVVIVIASLPAVGREYNDEAIYGSY